MPLDSQAKVFLQYFSKFPPLHELTVDAARNTSFPPGRPVEVAQVQDLVIDAPSGHRLPARLYRPTDSALPLLIYFHGGGFVLGTLDGYDNTCRSLANRSGCAVLSVAYRLAPEHPFPAAPDDALSAVRWVDVHRDGLRVADGRIAVGGDSAGGNLAAVTCIRVRDEGGPLLLGQLLVYPWVRHHTPAQGSMIENGRGFMLEHAGIRWFAEHYLRNPDDHAHPHYAVALTQNLSNLPPALVITAEFDPLRDEGELFAEQLKSAGNAVAMHRYDGMIHGFFGMSGIDRGAHAVDAAADWLRDILHSRC